MTDKDISQYDFGLAIRSAHEKSNDSLRVTSANTSVPPQYSRVSLTYNAQNSVTEACFYGGLYSEVRHIGFEADVAGSLNNTYFTLFSENDESCYHVWYNVDGGGTDPAPANSKPIEVQISSNDPASVVTLATKLYLEKIEEFKLYTIGDTCLKIENKRKGLATDTSDFGTGFVIDTVRQGEETLIKQVKVPYDGKTRYLYNTQEKRFEIIPTGDITVELTGEVDIKDPNTLEILNETIALNNVEESIVLPDDTKRFTIKARNNAKLNLAFNVGETTTKYRTIAAGDVWESNGIDIPNSTTIYVLSNKDSTVLEINIWRRV